MIKKAGIIGAGAVGGMYAKILTSAIGKENVFVISDAERTERYKRDGIIINGEKFDFNYVPDTDTDKKVDLLIFATKFHHLEKAINSAVNFVQPGTIILSAINGIFSEEIIGKKFGMEKMLYAVAMGMDSTKFGNKINYSCTGKLAIGEWDNSRSARLNAVTDFFDRTGFPYEVPESMPKRMWGKFMINVGLNQICAVYDLPYGGVQSPGEPRSNMIAAMKEVQTISQRTGVNLDDRDFDYWLKFNDILTPDSMPSMRQDVIAKRKTEVELFAGAVVEMGKKYGIEVPVNTRLLEEIRNIESNYNK